MTEEKLNELCTIQKNIQGQINKVKETDEFVVLICSTIDNWCKKNNTCKYIVSDTIRNTIFETKELMK